MVPGDPDRPGTLIHVGIENQKDVFRNVARN